MSRNVRTIEAIDEHGSGAFGVDLDARALSFLLLGGALLLIGRRCGSPS